MSHDIASIKPGANVARKRRVSNCALIEVPRVCNAEEREDNQKNNKEGAIHEHNLTPYTPVPATFMFGRYDVGMDMSQMTEEEWKKLLSPEEYAVLREGATETPFSGAYVTTDTEGMYHCKACKVLLFSSDKKLDSSESGPGLHGWPSFSDAALMENIGLRPDTSHGMVRTEVFCKNCGSHLGHVFDETVQDEDRKHYCINSVALEFEKKDTNPS